MSGCKIKSRKELKAIISRLRHEGRRVIFTNGCFDLLHYGHLRYLEAAKEKADILVVGVNSDDSVKRIKGTKRPIMPQLDRAALIAGLGCVDYVVVFKEDTPLNVIRSLSPDIIVKGADWDKGSIVGAKFVSSYGGKIETLPLVRGRSTTKIIEKIIRVFSRQRP